MKVEYILLLVSLVSAIVLVVLWSNRMISEVNRRHKEEMDKIDKKAEFLRKRHEQRMQKIARSYEDKSKNHNDVPLV